ncbi:MAG: M20/M25/M40 family metallo-hydrolase [Hydrotalea sp.]|nr:M20/M25/M40 family metallo-hydrolase [Hydrotalea sp.]
MDKKVILSIAVIVLFLIAFIIVRTVSYPFGKPSVDSEVIAAQIDSTEIQRFAGGLKFETVSFGDSTLMRYGAFDSFRTYLQSQYSQVFATCEVELLEKHSLVLRWKGKDTTLLPLLFLSHYDVVPPGDYSNDESTDVFDWSHDHVHNSNVPKEVASSWEFPPFSGSVKGGRIYGRGALDMKNMLFALLESSNRLIAKGYQPSRTIYFSFGHDEEIGGINGARKVAAHFKQKGLRFEAVYDEGGIIAAKGSLPGIDAPVALVGLAEKGFVTYKFKVKGVGGHSSMPPLQSAMGAASIIMQRLENEQMKPQLIQPIKSFLSNVGGVMGWVNKMAIANLWLFEPILLKQFVKEPSTNALVQSTTALTMMKGSDGENVLPPIAEFTANFRILPGNTVADIRAHVEAACKGYDVEIVQVREAREPSNISPIDSRSYQIIEESIKRLYPETLITPYITIGGTDAIKYEIVSNNVYRFMPIVLNQPEQRSIHNFNESISIQNYANMIAHFSYIMEHYDQK